MNEEKKSGMSPIVKGGLACCAILALLVVGTCVGFGVWSQSLLTVDPVKTAAAFKRISGAEPKGDLNARFALDTTPMPIILACATEDDELDLTLVGIMIPHDPNSPLPEHEVAWIQVVNAMGASIAPALSQKGGSLPSTLNSVEDTADPVEGELKVGDKTFKTITIACKHREGTDMKRIYIPLAGSSGVFAIGSVEDFDQDELEDYLENCTPR